MDRLDAWSRDAPRSNILSETCPETGQELSLKIYNFAVDGMAFLQNPRGLNYFLIGNCRKRHMISFYTNDTSNSLGSAESMAQVSGQLAPQPGAAAEPAPTPGPRESWQSSGSPGKWAGTVFLGVGYAVSYQVLCSLFCDRGCKALVFSFTEHILGP